MNYDPDDLKKDFLTRTTQVLKHYKEYVPPDSDTTEHKKYEVTLLINCLVGLLVLPDSYDLIRKEDNKPVVELNDWGIREEHIKNPGK
jgi:hypothetical protein